MSQNREKMTNRIVISAIVASSIFSLVFLGYVMESTFAGGVSSVGIGSKSGSSLSGQQINAGRANDSGSGYTAAPRPSPTPTPTPDPNALPIIAGFNPDMKLERIGIWWDGQMDKGKASSDTYLRQTYTQMCLLLEEIKDYTPSGNKLMFTHTYDGGRELEFAVYDGHVAEFKSHAGRYFKIPRISNLADALLPIQDGEQKSDIKSRMEDSGMLGFYGEEHNKVYLDKDVSKKVTGSFFALEKEETLEPSELGKRTTALVFYYHGTKYYIDVFDNGFIKCYSGNRDWWYNAPLDKLKEFESSIAR